MKHNYKTIVLSYVISFAILWTLSALLFAKHNVTFSFVLMLPIFPFIIAIGSISSLFWQKMATDLHSRLALSVIGLFILIFSLFPIYSVYLSLSRNKSAYLIIAHVGIIAYWVLALIIGIIIAVD